MLLSSQTSMKFYFLGKALFLILIIGIIFFGFLFFREKLEEKQEVKILPENDSLGLELGLKEGKIEEKEKIELELVAIYKTSGQAEFVFISGNLAYLADGFSGLQIFDISQPEEPRLVGSYNTPGYSEGVFVLKNLAFIADKDGGFLVLDVAVPENPKLISRDPGISIEGVFVSGNHAFLASKGIGLQVVKIFENN